MTALRIRMGHKLALGNLLGWIRFVPSLFYSLRAARRGRARRGPRAGAGRRGQGREWGSTAIPRGPPRRLCLGPLLSACLLPNEVEVSAYPTHESRRSFYFVGLSNGV